MRLVVGLAIGTAALVGGCCKRSSAVPERGVAGPTPTGSAMVWVTDDGDRIASKAGVVPLMAGLDNPVWSPGSPARLFGLPGETVAIQVVVTGGDSALAGVEVGVSPFRVAGQSETAAIHAERFVVAELQMPQRSGGKTPGESLGWAAGSMPADPSVDGAVPDPLIPIEFAQPWADYPMTVPAGRHRVLWVDLDLAETGLGAATYSSELTVTRPGSAALARIPIELQVGGPRLPYAAVRTMVYLDPAEIEGRTGSSAAIEPAFQLLHSHHLSAAFPLVSPDDVRKYQDVLTGVAFTPARGYSGAGAGRPADVVVIGTYGDLGEPSAGNVEKLREIVKSLQAIGIQDEPGKTDVFVYAADESCEDPAGAGWRNAIRAAGDLRVRVGWTCSEKPAGQPVDIPILFPSAYDPKLVQDAEALGKRVWIYNGELPATGSFLTDSWAVSLRANAWIQAAYGIDRWFYWESTFWNDDNRGGQGPYDPLAVAETFHNQHGDHCNGDGVLMYPGSQQQGGRRTAGAETVFPSMRMKQWRRGIQDAGYLRLARAVDREEADAVWSALLGPVLADAKPGAPAWPTKGKPWYEARRKLFDLITTLR